MKYIICLCMLGSLQSGFTQQSKNWVVLEGQSRNFNNQVQVEDMSELNELSLPDPARFFVPDANGRFSIRFNLSAPNYFRIGRNIVYLSPGDSLSVFIDYRDPKLASFTGKHSHENEYLRETPFPKGGSFLEAGKLIRSTVDSTVLAIMNVADARGRSLAGYTGLEKEFIQLETARIRADILNSIAGIRFYFPYARKLSKDSTEVFQKNFAELIAPYSARYRAGFIDPGFLTLAVYRDVVDDLLAAEKNNGPKHQQVRDWIAARELAQQLKKASDRDTKTKLAPALTRISSKVYRNALKEMLDKVMQLSNGDPVVDFTVMDQQSRTAKLSDLKGKVIYLDLWATWCGPCLAEMPAYEKLKDAYKDHPDMRFISLSIDDDKQAWRTNMEKRNAQGLQWIIDRAKLQPYNIIGIPRSILIDKDFRIVDMNAPLPSYKNINTVLDGLLK